MKIADLTHEQLCKIADNWPLWMADYRPEWCANHRPDIYERYVAQDLPAEIEALLKEETP